MKKVIEIIVTLPQWLFFVSPSILGYMTRSHPDSNGNTMIMTKIVEVVCIFSYSSHLVFGRFFNGVNSTSNRIYNYLVFIVMLFIEVIVCYTDKRIAVSSYWVPQFVFDFFSPNEIAVKLLSLTVIFLLLFAIYKKSLVLYEE